MSNGSGKIKVIILDLDNTIYPVSAIGEELFAPLIDLFKQSGIDDETIFRIKPEIMRRPFQQVAEEFGLNEELIQASNDLLSTTRYSGDIAFFEGYEAIRKLPLKKYLVTTGYGEMQNSKIDGLQIRGDFEEIYIIDPTKHEYGKKEVFAKILKQEEIEPEEALVIGDDPGSEIQAADNLGIGTIIFDPSDRFMHANVDFRVRDYKEIINITEQLI